MTALPRCALLFAAPPLLTPYLAIAPFAAGIGALAAIDMPL